MKKVCAVLLIMIVVLCGCATDPQTYYFNSTEIAEKVVKIELAMCDNPSPVIVHVEEDTVLHFDINNVIIIEELEQEKINDFVGELSTITFHKEKKSVNSPTGYTLLMYMQNEDIIVLSCTIISGTAYQMAAIFSNRGDFITHIAQFADEPSFKRLLTKYFNCFSEPSL